MHKKVSVLIMGIIISACLQSFQLWPAAETYMVTTIAGNGEDRWIDGPAGKNSLSGELGNLTVDASGNIYVMDFTNLRKISPDGTVNTLFGSLIYGDDGNPKEIGRQIEKGARGIVIDKNGNIFVSEKNGHAIRKITNEEKVELYAGNTDYSGADDGDAASAEFKSPKDMCIDKSGAIYLIDNYHKVRKISADGKKVSTLAGNDNGADFKPGTGKAASLKDIGGITVDSKGNVYVSQPDINCILRVSPVGAVTVFAGDPVVTNGFTKDGAGKLARFLRPGAIACGPDDNIYVADSRKIRKITPAGVVTTIAGASKDGVSVGGFRDGDGTKALFSSFDGIACDAAGNIYVSDIGNRRVRKLSKQ